MELDVAMLNEKKAILANHKLYSFIYIETWNSQLCVNGYPELGIWKEEVVKGIASMWCELFLTKWNCSTVDCGDRLQFLIFKEVMDELQNIWAKSQKTIIKEVKEMPVWSTLA